MKKRIASAVHLLISALFIVACVECIINDSATVGTYIVLVLSSLFCLLQVLEWGLELLSKVLGVVYSRRFCRQYADFFENLKEIHTLRYKCLFSADTIEKADVYTAHIKRLGTHMLAVGNSVIGDGLLHDKQLEEIQFLMKKTMRLLSQTQPINEQNT